MQITIERPQDFPLVDWLTCCTQAYRAALLNDRDLTTQQQERYYATTRVVEGSSVAWSVAILPDAVYLYVYINMEYAVLQHNHSDLTPDIHAEMERVITEIRVCLP